jgi:hypothetical protein
LPAANTGTRPFSDAQALELLAVEPTFVGDDIAAVDLEAR